MTFFLFKTSFYLFFLKTSNTNCGIITPSLHARRQRTRADSRARRLNATHLSGFDRTPENRDDLWRNPSNPFVNMATRFINTSKDVI